MITVLMQTILAERSRSGKRRHDREIRPGTTVADLILEEGFVGELEELLLVMVNGHHAEVTSVLQDGDTVDLILPIAGGDGRVDHIG